VDPNTLKLLLAGGVAYFVWLLYSKTNNPPVSEDAYYAQSMETAKTKAEAHAALMLSKPAVVSAYAQPWYRSKPADPATLKPGDPTIVDDYDRAPRGWQVIHKLSGDPTRYATSFPA